MSVSIEYLGRWGNQIFQYACGRIFAEENNLKLLTAFPKDGIFDVNENPNGRTVEKDVSTLDDFSAILDRRYAPGKYLLRGFFQKASWYLSRKDRISAFMRPRSSRFKRNTDDIAIHLRLGDFKVMKWCIHPDWYLSILKRESFRRVYIFTDELDRDYLKAFSAYKPEVLHGNPEEDWQHLRSFDRMVLSMSTFAWWAAFFGDPKNLYLFKRYPFGDGLINIPGAQGIDGRLLHEGVPAC